MSDTFATGQRWISATETDLGLGTVLDVEFRHVTVVFMATGDTRVYARESAPLTRVAFSRGDRIASHEGWQLLVENVEEKAGVYTYHGKRSDNGAPAVMEESELDNFLQFQTPRDRLFAGLIDGQRWFNLRRQVFIHRHALAHSSVRGLSGARVSLLPHQVYIAVEAGRRLHPRVLLADEVGLGKTVEAGMILHAQWVNRQVSRVLIVVPPALLHQWLVEMRRKFNLAFSIIDEERFLELQPSAPDDNPFLAEQLVLCSMDELLADDLIGDAAIAAGWDMIIVDEAHHLEWQPDEPSPAYALVDELASATPSVLLLTATPEQLGQAGHFARLRLLDPDRFSDLEHYIKEETGFGAIAAIADRLNSDVALPAHDIDQLETLLQQPFDESERKTLGSDALLAMSDLGAKLIDTLVDRHGTGRLMFRNTRHAISGFPERKLHLHELDGSSVAGLATWLIGFLAEHHPSKVLLIAAHVATVQALAEALRQAGVATAQFHEHMSIVERDRAAAWFSHPEESCQLLLCSEIGSEGRNFQFLHHLVCIELPMSPDLLEQRIGRLDRIGQTHTVDIHVPRLAGSRDDVLARWYHEGLNAFEKPSHSGSAIARRLDEPLKQAVARAEQGEPEDSSFNELISQTRQLAEELDAELEQGRDRLLELNSNRPERIQVQLDELARLDRSYALQDFMGAVFDRFGVNIDEQRDHWILHPSDNMQIATFPGLPVDGLSVTFERSTALAREDFSYLSWDHPMVVGAMDLILDEGFGQAYCQVVGIDEVPKGLAFVEALYVLQCSGDAKLNMQRYLPAELQAWHVGLDGRNYTETLRGVDLDSTRQNYDRNTLKQVVQKHRPSFEKLLDATERLAKATLPDAMALAGEAVEKEHAEERERLLALQQVNPAVKDSEIEALDALYEQRREALTGTHVRPVSVRVVFNR